MFRRVSVAGGLVAAAFIGGLIGAACSGEGDAQEADQQVLNVALATRVMDEAGFHEVQESIAEGEIPAEAATTALRMRALVLATDWPDPLADGAEQLATTLADAAAVYDVGDPASALPNAESVHDTQHEFSGLTWSWIGEETGVEDIIQPSDEGEEDGG